MLFDLYTEYLLNSGIEEKQIIRINLEEFEFVDIENHKKLYKCIEYKLSKNFIYSLGKCIKKL